MFLRTNLVRPSLPGKASRPGRVAQLVEHSTLNRLVVGSIPTASTISPLILSNLAIETLAREKPRLSRILVHDGNYRPLLVTLCSHWAHATLITADRLRAEEEK